MALFLGSREQGRVSMGIHAQCLLPTLSPVSGTGLHFVASHFHLHPGVPASIQ